MKTGLRSHWTLLVTYLKPLWLGFLLLGGLVLASIALQLAIPQIVRHLIDSARSGEASRGLSAVALRFLIAALANQALSMASVYLGETVAWKATNALREDLVLHCLRLDMSFHQAHAPGELIERLDGDVMALGNFFSEMVIRLFGNALLTIGVLIFLVREDPRVGLIGVAHVVLTLVALGCVQKLAVAAWGEFRQASAELLGLLGERLEGTEDIRANGAVAYVMAQLHRLMGSLLVKGRRAALMGELTFSAGFSVQILSTAATLALGGIAFSRGEMTIGTLYLLVDYVRRLDRPVGEIRRQATDMQAAAASVGRVQELLSTQSTLLEDKCATLPPGALAVSFSGVSFRYDDLLSEEAGRDDGVDRVLEDISFSLPAGETLGLLGRTGSGKSTLIRLLVRLYDAAQGKISLGGESVRHLSLCDLRKRVAVVTQEVQLFDATIRDNLTLFNRTIGDDLILAALDELGLAEWCRSLPDGLETQLESGAASLSAGEAQLLAFARAYLGDPGLVILDEASSRLDPATEQLLDHAVARLLHNRTAIIIAHRLSTVQNADAIMILDGGRIGEYGPREPLADDPTSRFYGLLETGLEKALA